MPANLPPNYHVVEARYKSATDPAEKLAALQELWVLLPKHKHTEKMQADLKTKLSQLRKTPGSRAGGRQKPEFCIERGGAGQLWLVGPPNAGRSSLLARLTTATPEISEGLFTTKKPVPGMLTFEDIGIQLVEAPAIYPTLTPKWLSPNLRIGDGVLLVFGLGSDELFEGVDEVLATLERAKIVLYPPASADLSAEALAEAEPDPPDEPGVELLPGFVVLNQADLDPDGGLEALLRDYLAEKGPAWAALPVLRVSAATGDGLAEVPRRLFDALSILRVYSKLPGKPPDLAAPFVRPRGTTVLELTEHIHKELAARFQFARLWRGDKYEGGRVSGDFVLEDRDIVEIHA